MQKAIIYEIDEVAAMATRLLVTEDSRTLKIHLGYNTCRFEIYRGGPSYDYYSFNVPYDSIRERITLEKAEEVNLHGLMNWNELKSLHNLITVLYKGCGSDLDKITAQYRFDQTCKLDRVWLKNELSAADHPLSQLELEEIFRRDYELEDSPGEARDRVLHALTTLVNDREVKILRASSPHTYALNVD